MISLEDPEVLGARFDGPVTNARLGSAVAGGGDLNGDGIADIVIGAPGTPVEQDGITLFAAGEAFVLFGPIDEGPFDLEQLREANGGDGSRGMVIQAEGDSHQMGRTLAIVDDVNGDGLDDLLVSAPEATSSVVFPDGIAYLIFGRTDFPAELEVRSLRATDDQNLNTGLGTVIPGLLPWGRLGDALSSAGDINGDGIEDLIIGNGLPPPDDDVDWGPPNSFVLYGRAGDDPWPAEIDIIAYATGNGDPEVGFMIVGETLSNLGASVAGVGDFTGDGMDDLAMGAPYAGALDPGQVVIIPGRDADSTPFGDRLDLSDADGLAGTWRITSSEEDERIGVEIRGVGDLDGDGRPDLAIGAPDSARFGDRAGAVFVVYGPDPGEDFANPFMVDSLLEETAAGDRRGFVLAGRPGDQLGVSIDVAGDLDGDGLQDLIIGAPGMNDGAEGGGGAVVLFGRRRSDRASLVSTDELVDEASQVGFALIGANAGGASGVAVAGAGDVNNDGSSDVLVGARLETGGGMFSGRVFVVLGSGNDVGHGFSAEQTGAYFEPDQPGQGVLMEVGTLGGDPALFAAWYTYLDGAQQWFAAGPIPFEEGADRIEGDLLVTRGADFGSAFDAADVVFETWGSITISTADCGALSWDYRSTDGSETGSLALSPLLAETLGLAPCRPAEPALAFGERPSVVLAGTWWNPDRAGEGVVIDIETRGAQPTAFFSWFTYQGGEQLWLVGSGPIDADGTRIASIPLVVTSGTGFGGAFDPDAVAVQDWGQATLTFLDCNTAQLDYSRTLGEGEEGSLALVRFTEGLFGQGCSD